MPTAPQYNETALFGGAITVDLPSDFADVSNIREVPDHQEVYLSRTGLTSIIVDIVEYAAPPSHPCTTDAEALIYHYGDIVASGYGRDGQQDAEGGGDKEETRIWKDEKVDIKRLPSTPVYTLFASQHPLKPPVAESAIPSSNPKPDFTAIFLTLIRLPAQDTDLLITVNVPHVRGEYQPQEVDFGKGLLRPLASAGFGYSQKIVETLQIVDWSLFGKG